MGQDTKHPAVGGKNPGLSVIFNDVSPSDKKIISSSLDCTIAISFGFVDIAMFVTGYTRLSVQPCSRSTSKLFADDIRTGSGPGGACRVEMGIMERGQGLSPIAHAWCRHCHWYEHICTNEVTGMFRLQCAWATKEHIR